MNLKLVVAILVIAAVPVCAAKAQKPSAVTKANGQTKHSFGDIGAARAARAQGCA
jgi:hypothetical protein